MAIRNWTQCLSSVIVLALKRVKQVFHYLQYVLTYCSIIYGGVTLSN